MIKISILDPKLNEHEKQVILWYKANTDWSWADIARELNKRFETYNNGTRDKSTIYKFMQRYRKEHRAQWIADLRLQGIPEEDIMRKLDEEYIEP